VAELAAAGRTNREIAQTLFLSVHTVEDNLRRVYGKLGIRSRTELAAKSRTLLACYLTSELLIRGLPVLSGVSS
jgi:DNA-binding CsgD family transcriptional regulator